MLETLMTQFAKDLELEEPLNTDIPNVYAIPLEDDLAITLSPIDPFGFSIQCEISECPSDELESFYSELLHANLFGQGTKGAILGLNEEKNKLMLTQDIDYDIDYQTFSDIIEDFINTVDLWRDETKAKIQGS